MAYTIFAFDGIAIPTYNPVHNLGTGRANVSFQQLPGGGYYDNYGSAKSSQGIRPIFVRGTSYEATSALLKTAIDNLRQKIGVRGGKLTAKFDDGSLRWQWARLTEVDTPSEWGLGSNRFDFVMTYTTAAQHWYGVIVTENQWSWGDLSWTFGDGTAELGENGSSYTLSATGATISGLTVSVAGTQQTLGSPTPNNGGNIAATNCIITVTAATDTIHAINWDNQTSGYEWSYETNITTGQSVTIDTGAMSVIHSSVGDDYANFTASDVSVWDKLSAGNNTIVLSVDGNEAADGTIVLEYYDHYA